MSCQWQWFSYRLVLAPDWNMKGTKHSGCRVNSWRTIRRIKEYSRYSQLPGTFIAVRQRASLTASKTVTMWGCCMLNLTMVIKNEAASPVVIIFLGGFIICITVQEKVQFQMQMVSFFSFFWVFLSEDTMLLKMKSTRKKENEFINKT